MTNAYLLLASYNGHLEEVRECLAAGANVHANDDRALRAMGLMQSTKLLDAHLKKK